MKCLNSFIGYSAFGGGSPNSLSLDPFTELIDAADQNIDIRRDLGYSIMTTQNPVAVYHWFKNVDERVLFYNMFIGISRNSFDFKIFVYFGLVYLFNRT